jgi:hypothetical protein
MADETQKPLKGWQAAAHGALAKYYTVLAERETYEVRLEAAKAEAERAGVSFRFGEPKVDAGEEALRCPCGAVVVLDYYRRADRDSKATIHCQPCRDKSAEAAAQDAELEGTPLPAQKPGSDAEIPF